MVLKPNGLRVAALSYCSRSKRYMLCVLMGPVDVPFTEVVSLLLPATMCRAAFPHSLTSPGAFNP